MGWWRDRKRAASSSGVLTCALVLWTGCGESSPSALDAGTGGPSAGAGGEAGESAVGYGGSDGLTCRPGDTRCHGDLGFQSCTPEGTWSESLSCSGYSENGTSSYCAVVTSGAQRWAACVDPACWWWQKSGLSADGARAGVCVADGSIEVCQPNGVLSASEPCNGSCRAIGAIDGRTLGYCDAQCSDGERECLAGPLYRECVAGAWSTEARVCAGGESCQPLSSGPKLAIECGGKCEPGTSRCAPDRSGIESCNPEVLWSEPAPCALGECVQSGAQAECQTQCKPGEYACAFDGDALARVCGAAGIWLDPSPCRADARCRIGAGRALGCLSCIGSAHPGGNAWGVADSRCLESGVATCGSNDEFAAVVACAEGKSCVERARAASSLAYCQ